LDEHIYAVPSRDIEDFVARLQAAMTTVDANMLRRVAENTVRRAAFCLETEGGRLDQLLCLGAPMFSSSGFAPFDGDVYLGN
jgi:hypothetical protein